MAKISFGGKSYDPRPPGNPNAKRDAQFRKLGEAGQRILGRKHMAAQGQKLGEAAAAALGTTTEALAASVAPKVSPYTVPGADESWKDQTYFDTTAGISKNLNNLQTYVKNAGIANSAESGIDFAYEDDPTKVDPANPLKLKAIGKNDDGTDKFFSIDENVDVKNPFSRAALLKRLHKQNTAGNTNSMAARGQLYSGALQNAQNEAGWQNQQAQDSLIKDFSGKFGGLYGTWLQGQGDAQTQGVDAQVAATARRADQPVATPSPQKLSMKQATARGITFVSEGGRLVAKDSQGKPIPGARVVVTGKTRHVIVPG